MTAVPPQELRFAQLGVQLAAVVTVGAFSFVTSLAAWYAIKHTMGLRVSAAHERAGLDLSEMGMEAYPADAVLDDTGAVPAPPLPEIPTVE